MASYLYGLDHASHDFTKVDSFGKNVFTNAFPASLAVYMHKEKSLELGWVEAISSGGTLTIAHGHKPLPDILGVDPDYAHWSFESPYDGYDIYATGQVNKSDLVVSDVRTGREASAFEVKLTVVPTSNTADHPRDDQSCELVVRPPSIEQLCFSIAAGYGPERRHDIGDAIASCLECPMDYEWNNERYMLEKLPKVVEAAETVAINDIDNQRPFLLDAIWRTEGKSPVFDREAFDAFFWSDIAFMQFFTRAAKAQIANKKKTIDRPARAVIWLVKSLWDYSTQGKVTFEKTHSSVTFGGQTDKAGAFTGNVSLAMVKCEDFIHPRVARSEISRIITPEGVAFLSPERRLDGVLASSYEYLMPKSQN